MKQIDTRKEQGLHPKPIEDAELVEALIAQIKDTNHPHRDDSVKFFIYNTLPGTTSAAGVKAQFLKQIITGAESVAEITQDFALELLSHMKGGPSVEVLLDLALGDDDAIAQKAATVLKTQVFLYEADTDRLEEAHKGGHAIASDILKSYANAEFFTKLPDVERDHSDRHICHCRRRCLNWTPPSPGAMLTRVPTASFMVSAFLSTTKRHKAS